MSPRPAAEGTIYNRLGVLRAAHGLSRTELAQALRVNYQTVGYLERGEYFPSLDLAMRIAALFGVRIEEVFSRKPFAP
jgi:putative transcriptional regulator